ncbi:hypothetical protein Tsubulata_036650 [Turnera subulata]|uniref:Peptidase A1 domain-containing protein n=1 Tax=Turnera subulata TaxID=218843 RepID=A0A9Q0FQ12_9ROSI|nr:hypothetical protein Tsubulata_036650 [Turnera subulata]
MASTTTILNLFASTTSLCLAIGVCMLSVIIEASSSSSSSCIYGGFTVNLIPRDSDHQLSQFDRLRNAAYRSMSRINRLRHSSLTEKALQSEIVAGGGEYLMRISIGTPPVELLAIADTGSDLIWTQCRPYRRSSSYHAVACGSKLCNALDNDVRACVDQKSSSSSSSACGYTYSYGDHSFTNGNLATETFRIGSSSSSSVEEGVVFGCGNRNGGTFEEQAAGIIGLGGGPLSLNSQLGDSIGGKFSYCLVPLTSSSSPSINNATSKISFGKQSVVHGPDAVVTPLVPKEPQTYYYLTLEAISVGQKRLPYNTVGNAALEGNIIIDSGTTLTFLDSEFFNELESAVEGAVKNGKRVSDPKGIFSICFQDGDNNNDNMELPVLTAHFRGAADVKLEPVNTFAQAEEGLLCFTMIPSNDIAIFGNLAQMNYLVGYDLHQRTVSFKPTDCANHH